MRTTIKSFLFGLVIGALLAFPLGMNFGRDEPLLSNPFTKRDINRRVKEGMKETTGALVEGTKGKIHEATKPMRDNGQE